jgi:hypothetical protein
MGSKNWIIGIIAAFCLFGAITSFVDNNIDVAIILSVLVVAAVIYIWKNRKK